MCLLDIEVAEVLDAVERRLAARSVAVADARRRAASRALARRRSGFVFGVARPVARAADAAHRSLAGSVVAVVGEALRVWAAGHLNKSREVTSSGPYRWFAHPLYVGSSVMGVGPRDRVAAAWSSPALIALYLAATLTRGDQERGGVSAADVRRSVRSLSARRSARRDRGARRGDSAWRRRSPTASIARVGGLVGRGVAARVEGNV